MLSLNFIYIGISDPTVIPLEDQFEVPFEVSFEGPFCVSFSEALFEELLLVIELLNISYKVIYYLNIF